MRPRRRDSVKALLLALTALSVGALPMLSLSQFLWVMGIVFGIAGTVLLGMFMGMVIEARKMYRGFRAFEKATEQAWRDISGRGRRMRLVR